MSDRLGLAGRIALVTGASGGIGSAICRRLACDVAGIALAYGSNTELAEALAVGIVSVAGQRVFSSDMADVGAPERLIDDVEVEFGPVDILVVNHGLARQAGYEDVDVAAFDHTLAVNLRASFLLACRALPRMRERGFARILVISSVAAFRNGVIGPDYASSKAASTVSRTSWAAAWLLTASPSTSLRQASSRPRCFPMIRGSWLRPYPPAESAALKRSLTSQSPSCTTATSTARCSGIDGGCIPLSGDTFRSVQPRATALGSHIREGIENREADA